MVERAAEVRHVKSPLWRLVSATGVSIGGIGTPYAGFEIVFRFSVDWLDIEKETFKADFDDAAGTMLVTENAKIINGPLYKMEEVAVKIPAEVFVAFVGALIGQIPHLTPEQQKKVRDEISKMPKG